MNRIFMERALELAKKGIGFTSPNPAVGAVIVKGDRIVAEGYHHRAGSDHAEIVAMRELMNKSGVKSVDFDPMLFQNAILYVTLEPCCHVGKTPACARTIVAAGFRKVFIGMKDPFKKVNGRGIRYLKNHGIDVEVLSARSRLAEEIRSINQPFIKFVTTGLPYVVMKAGLSLDGKIAPLDGKSKWITSLPARRDARLMRSRCDAVIVGNGTVSVDDPELAPFGRYRGKNILRVVIDKKLELDISRKIFRDENVLVACADQASEKNKKRFSDAGVEFKSFGQKDVSVKKLLNYLAKRDVCSVFVEGGSSIHGAFFDQAMQNDKLLDYVLFYLAPTLIGGRKSKSAIGGIGAKSLASAVNMRKMQFVRIGSDLKVEGPIKIY